MIDRLEELQELDRAVTLMQRADDLSAAATSAAVRAVLAGH